MVSDLRITCASCGGEFLFSVEEQQFYQGQGYTRAPRRCRSCRRHRKSLDRHARQPRRKFRAPRERTSHPATCTGCGAKTTVPFVPDGARPVFCRTCYSSRGRGARG